MYRRFHGTKQRANPSGKWIRVPQTGIGKVLRESDGTWNLEVSHRRVGNTIRRDVYSVSIRAEAPAQEEFLSGFHSKEAAIEAGRKRALVLQNLRDRVHARSHHDAVSPPPEKSRI